MLDVGRYGHIPQHPSATAGGRIVVMLVVVTNALGLTVRLLYGILDTAYPTLVAHDLSTGANRVIKRGHG